VRRESADPKAVAEEVRAEAGTGRVRLPAARFAEEVDRAVDQLRGDNEAIRVTARVTAFQRITERLATRPARATLDAMEALGPLRDRQSF
jgi:hypothetical protein